MNIEGTLDTKLKSNIIHFDKNFQLITKDFDKFSLSIEFKRGYVANNQVGFYIDTLNFPFFNLKYSTDYALPSNIFTLIVEKKYCVENLKNLVKEVFRKYS